MTLGALTIYEPWASLMFPGPDHGRFKTIETRSWSTPYRGDVLICAAARKPDTVTPGVGLCGPTGAGLWYLQMPDRRPGVLADGDKITVRLAPGMALGIARLDDCLPIIDPDECEWDEQTTTDRSGPPCAHAAIDGQVIHHRPTAEFVAHTWVLTEQPFGDYTPGRFAWVFEQFRPLGEPRPRKGAQGLRQLSADEERQWRDEVEF